MRLRKFLTGIWNKYFKREQPVVTESVCGVNLKLIKGTVRRKPDMDDAWFFALASHHKAIFDVGSNTGYTALLALIQDPDRPYLLVDPNEEALDCAQKNLMMNALGSKARYRSVLVSDVSDDKEDFYTIGTGAAGSIYKSHATSAASVGARNKVDTITLDDLWKAQKINPDLVKIDVEGAEFKVLQGGIELTHTVNPTYLVELHALSERSMAENAIELLKWCGQVSYSAWYLKTKELLQTSDQISDRGKCHVLLIPSDLSLPKYLRYIEQYDNPPNLDS